MNFSVHGLPWKFFRFLAAGGIAAVANFGSRFGYSLVMTYEAAILCAYLTGMLVAFLLMRKHVFNAAAGQLFAQASWFAVVNALALIQTLIISIILARWLLLYVGTAKHAEALAHFIGVLTPAVTSYYGHKLLTFR